MNDTTPGADAATGDGRVLDPARIADHLAIQDLATAYAYAVDDKDWVRWEALFTPGAQVDYLAAGGIAGTAAAAGHRNRSGTPRSLEKARVAGNTRGIERVDIHTVNGAPHLRQIAVDGATQLHPLTRAKILRRSDRDSWRLYGEYELPNLIGGGTIRIRLDRTSQDVKAGFNREENLRAIAPADPDHDRLMARRNDTESGNRLLDDSMRGERVS